MNRWAALTALCVIATATPAHAEIPVGLIEDMVGGMVKRTRRSIAIGPEAGYVGGVNTDGSGLQGVSFGLALYTFKIPSILDMRARVEAKVKERLEEYVKQVVATGSPPPENMEEVVKKIANEVIDELMTGELVRSKWEKPGTKILLEGIALLDPGGFQVRLGVSRGIKRMSFGLGGGYQRTSGTNIGLVGAELSAHLTPIGENRTPVVDLFLRTDVSLQGDDSTLFFLLGARLTLDLL